MIDVQLAAVMEIQAVVQLGEALHPGARTAPEMLERGTVYLEISCSHRLKIHGHPGIRMLRGQDGIDVGVLVEIGIFNVTRNLEQLAGQLQHVIGIAGFAGEVGTVTV
ncbi:hypothetical protein D3C71_1151500 [compost metagenome]